jgi:hypothetical protein
MEKLLTINHLMYSRAHCIRLLVESLIRMKNKSCIKLNIMPMLHAWDTIEGLKLDDVFKKLSQNQIDFEINPVPNNTDNYLRKINIAVNQKTPYSMKLDEDCYVNPQTLDYIVDNLSVLDDKDTLLMTPIVSNGIPTVDLFIDKFMSGEEKKGIWSIFNKTSMSNNLWGADYSRLNKHTTQKTYWDPNSFYDEVRQLPYFYKGIHPVRVSEEAQDFIRDFILRNISTYWGSCPEGIKKIKPVYLCNSIFIIKTDLWKSIINRKDLYRDAFDEVTLNLYMEETNKKIAIIDGSYCIHLYYNTIIEFGGDFIGKCNSFYDSIILELSRIIK